MSANLTAARTLHTHITVRLRLGRATQKPPSTWRGTKVAFRQGSLQRGRCAEKRSRVPSPAPRHIGSERVRVSERVCCRTHRYRLYCSGEKGKPPPARKREAFRGWRVRLQTRGRFPWENGTETHSTTRIKREIHFACARAHTWNRQKTAVAPCCKYWHVCSTLAAVLGTEEMLPAGTEAAFLPADLEVTQCSSLTRVFLCATGGGGSRSRAWSISPAARVPGPRGPPSFIIKVPRYLNNAV